MYECPVCGAPYDFAEEADNCAWADDEEDNGPLGWSGVWS